jgi:hypothetical protein
MMDNPKKNAKFNFFDFANLTLQFEQILANCGANLLINLCKFQLCGEVKAIEIAYPD